MDAAATSKHSLRLVLDIARSGDGRLEGQLRTLTANPDTTNRAETAKPGMSFSGVLEFLKVLEDLLDNA